ncbi:brain acid soluble protein 1-like, partial [Manduca sexta]|uniref:brain acid soluble protein 1-like n=1 Tax=Manduca sexta TaxID=7130 RepID=UPI00188F0B8C
QEDKSSLSTASPKPASAAEPNNHANTAEELPTIEEATDGEAAAEEADAEEAAAKEAASDEAAADEAAAEETAAKEATAGEATADEVTAEEAAAEEGSATNPGDESSDDTVVSPEDAATTADEIPTSDEATYSSPEISPITPLDSNTEASADEQNTGDDVPTVPEEVMSDVPTQDTDSPSSTYELGPATEPALLHAYAQVYTHTRIERDG